VLKPIHVGNLGTPSRLGGYFMVGASNAYNQIIEKDLDALNE
jgi:heme O synthase-like polyprenyltransferase